MMGQKNRFGANLKNKKGKKRTLRADIGSLKAPRWYLICFLEMRSL